MVAQDARSLLIADDDDQVRWTLREIFEPVGFQVFACCSGEEALAQLEDHAFDCLLIDMHMTGLTGLETVELAHQQLVLLPAFVLLTSDASQDLLRQALALQVFTVLHKPVSRALVTHTVSKAISNRLRAG
ncbi:MAG TPA: response regulator [Planctomycetia bacterium]|nr:response regulator [Planctomycetia bacterium]